jgi:sugar lactone lactonase YvrE
LTLNISSLPRIFLVKVSWLAQEEAAADVIGVLWDSRTQLLHWVDIDKAEVHTYELPTSVSMLS